MIEITAAVARPGEKDFSVEQLRLDGPRPDEILVQIAAVGICHTDLSVRDGLKPGASAVLGHEGAGIVEQVGEAVSRFKPGDRVALSFHSCGSCTCCLDRHPAYCDQFFPLNFGGVRVDGSRTITGDGEPIAGSFFGQSSFASRVLAYERNAVLLPDDMSFEIAAPFGCGVQTGAGAVINSMACREGSSLLILGGGSVGLSAVMAGAVQKCRSVIVVEPHAERRRLALEIGATHAVDPAAGAVVEQVRAIVPGGVDYALDTSGRLDVITLGLEALGARGVLGLVAGGGIMNLDLVGLVKAGKSIMGIIEGDSEPELFIPYLMRLQRGGRFPFEKLIKTYPFAEINQAIRDQHAGKCVKAVLTF